MAAQMVGVAVMAIGAGLASVAAGWIVGGLGLLAVGTVAEINQARRVEVERPAPERVPWD